MEPLRFLGTDLGDGVPCPGWYVSTVSTACWRRSKRDNRMIYVVHALECVASPFDRVCDFFVLEGATQQGLAYSRRRLVELYRACGLSPRIGDEIRPGELAGRRLEIKVDHELWKGKTQLRVVGHRPLLQGHDDEDGEEQLSLFPSPPDRLEGSHA